MRIALLVALAYMVAVPFIINIVDDRPRDDRPAYRGYRSEQVRSPDRRYLGRGEFPGHPKYTHFYDYPKRHDERHFFFRQVICVFLITVAMRTRYKLDGVSRHLAALQKIRERKAASADQPGGATS